MKTITTEVPSKVTKTIYECDHCPFNASLPQVVKYHEFQSHQMKTTTTINGVRFFWMDCRQDFDNLVENGIRVRVCGEFKEIGWYGIQEDEGDDYDEYTVDIRYISEFIQVWTYEIEWAQKVIKEAQELMEQKHV
jgi:hypothetical protein